MTTRNDFSDEFVKHTFTADEKQAIAMEMAQKVSELQKTEDNKKAVMSDYKSQIDSFQASVNLAAIKLTNGYEMRAIQCEIVPNWDKKVWEFMRVDTGELAKTKQMSSDDLQLKV